MPIIEAAYKAIDSAASKHSSTIDFLVADFRMITGLVLLPEDFQKLPHLSKGLENNDNISAKTKSAMIFSDEDHHHAAVLLGMIIKKSEEEAHPVVSFLKVEEASDWLEIDISNLVARSVD